MLTLFLNLKINVWRIILNQSQIVIYINLPIIISFYISCNILFSILLFHLFSRCIYTERFNCWMKCCIQCPSMDHEQSNNFIDSSYERRKKSITMLLLKSSVTYVWTIIQVILAWEREWTHRMDQIHQTYDQTIKTRNLAGELGEEILRKLFIYLTTRDIITCVGQGFPNSPTSMLQMVRR